MNFCLARLFDFEFADVHLHFGLLESIASASVVVSTQKYLFLRWHCLSFLLRDGIVIEFKCLI